MSCNWEVMPSLIASWNRQINWQRQIVEVYQCSIPERSIQDKPISQEKLIHVLQLEKCTPGKNVLLEKCTPQKNVPAGSLLWTEKNHWRHFFKKMKMPKTSYPIPMLKPIPLPWKVHEGRHHPGCRGWKIVRDVNKMFVKCFQRVWRFRSKLEESFEEKGQLCEHWRVSHS